MKNSIKCPKCQSEQVVKINPNDSMGIRISTGAMSMAKIAHYVCCNCGYLEEWIDSPVDLDKIKKKYLADK